MSTTCSVVQQGALQLVENGSAKNIVFCSLFLRDEMQEIGLILACSYPLRELGDQLALNYHLLALKCRVFPF